MKIIVSGLEWMGNGTESIKSSLEELLQSAEIEVIATTYSLTIQAQEFFDGIESCLKRGVRVSLIINRYDEQEKSAKHHILSMVNTYEKFDVFDFAPDQYDLHSKLIVVDRKRAIVGSANISKRGLNNNWELAVLIEDNNQASSVADAVDRLFNLRFVNKIDPDNLNH